MHSRDRGSLLESLQTCLHASHLASTIHLPAPFMAPYRVQAIGWQPSTTATLDMCLILKSVRVRNLKDGSTRELHNSTANFGLTNERGAGNASHQLMAEVWALLPHTTTLQEAGKGVGWVEQHRGVSESDVWAFFQHLTLCSIQLKSGKVEEMAEVQYTLEDVTLPNLQPFELRISGCCVYVCVLVCVHVCMCV